MMARRQNREKQSMHILLNIPAGQEFGNDGSVDSRGSSRALWLPLAIAVALTFFVVACGGAEPDGVAEPETEPEAEEQIAEEADEENDDFVEEEPPADEVDESAEQQDEQLAQEGPTTEELAAQNAREEEERRREAQARESAMGAEMMAHDFTGEPGSEMGNLPAPWPPEKSLEEILEEEETSEDAFEPEEPVAGYRGERLAAVAPGLLTESQRSAASSATPVQVAVLHQPGQEEIALGIALVIESFQRKNLEKAVGAPVKIAFISRAPEPQSTPNLIRYREGALQAALQVASVLPSAQSLEPMNEQEQARLGIDIYIYVGEGSR
ncbi:MAG: hypothetical protein IID61_01475 [SAR324 cluster bacterium]|nr:hypothetical protein [SAR324 cluster bacterium]